MVVLWNFSGVWKGCLWGAEKSDSEHYLLLWHALYYCPSNITSFITIIKSCTSIPTPKLIYEWSPELGKRKNFVGAFLRCHWVFNSHCAQSLKSSSKRIFLLVNATQFDLMSLQSLGLVLEHQPPNELYVWPRELGKRKNFVGAKTRDWVCICSCGFLK